jgi:hypothetical protein
VSGSPRPPRRPGLWLRIAVGLWPLASLVYLAIGLYVLIA